MEYDTAQLKRAAGPSGPRDVPSFLKEITYMRDASGNINFEEKPKPVPATGYWFNPVQANSKVNLCEDTRTTDRGQLPSGKIVKLSDASRAQHFAIANQIAAKHGQTYGVGNSSPTGWTWHHLLEKYKMVLVNRTVHQKFGHNGSFYFW